jgi:hypothetical protein
MEKPKRYGRILASGSIPLDFHPWESLDAAPLTAEEREVVERLKRGQMDVATGRRFLEIQKKHQPAH